MTARGPGAVCAAAMWVLSLGATTPTRVVTVHGPVTRPTAQRMAIPDLASQANAGKFIREVFRSDYGNTMPSQRREFARRLLAQGLETHNDPTMRFVLFREARDIAASAADARLATRAIQMLDRDFVIDEIRMIVPTLRTSFDAARSPDEFGAVTHAGIAAIRKAVRRDDYDAAGALTSLSSSAVRRATDAVLESQIRELGAEVQKLGKDFLAVKAAKKAIAENGENAETALKVGRHMCFVRSDFEAGLPLLARCSDQVLRAMANRELGGAATSQQKVKLANDWWDLAAAQTPTVAGNLRNHAAAIYQEAIPGLKGFDRSAAERRLEAYHDTLVTELGLRRGLYAELYKGVTFVTRVKSRIDPTIDFDWGLQTADPALPKDDFSIRWTGHLLANIGGRYELVLHANAGARIWIDDKIIFDEPDLTRKRKGAAVLLELSAGLHDVRIDYWDAGGAARMRLSWRAPGATEDEVLPGRCWYHEAGLAAQ